MNTSDKKVLDCGCQESGCVCKNKVTVPQYVPAGTPTICIKCSQGRHTKMQQKKTSVQHHGDYFVKNG